MKKLLLFFVFASACQMVFAQCIPSAAVTVHDTAYCYYHSFNSITNMPTGTVVQIHIRDACNLRVEMCHSVNPDTANHDNSYLTLLNANSGTAIAIDSADDGCSTSNGPTATTFRHLTPGYYYIYLTEWNPAHTNHCVANGANTTYRMYINGLSPTENDECNTPEPLELGVPVQTISAGATRTTASEGEGPNTVEPQLSTVGIFAPANFPYGTAVGGVVWYSFVAPTDGAYYLTIHDTTTNMFNFYSYEFAVYPQGDINCSDIHQSDLSHGMYRFFQDSVTKPHREALTLAAGDYLIALQQSGYYPGTFTVQMDSAPEQVCADAEAGTLSINNDCIVYGDILSIVRTGQRFAPGVGALAGYYSILSLGPITNFENPKADVNRGYAFADDPYYDFAVETNNPGFNLPPNTYYYYFVAAGNVSRTNDTLHFSTACLDTVGLTFRVVDSAAQCLTGIKSITAAPSLELYPNPTNTALNIRTDEVNGGVYQIINTSGQICLTGNMHSTAHIDISSLTPGIYLLSMSLAKQKVTKRFSVVR